LLQAKKMDFYCKINLLSNGTFYESIKNTKPEIRNLKLQ